VAVSAARDDPKATVLKPQCHDSRIGDDFSGMVPESFGHSQAKHHCLRYHPLRVHRALGTGEYSGIDRLSVASPRQNDAARTVPNVLYVVRVTKS